jgi:hypothetical protein
MRSSSLQHRQAVGNRRIGSVAILLVFCCLRMLFFSTATPRTNTGDSTATVNAVAGVFELAARQSYGFFDNVPAESWNLHRNIYLQSRNHNDPDNPLRGSQFISNKTPPWQSIPATWYQNNYEPNFSCAFEKRIGVNMNGDGPKWVCRSTITISKVFLYAICLFCSLSVLAALFPYGHNSRYATRIGSKDLPWNERQGIRAIEGASSTL